jgi:hypothetical protein
VFLPKYSAIVTFALPPSLRLFSSFYPHRSVFSSFSYTADRTYYICSLSQPARGVIHNLKWWSGLINDSYTVTAVPKLWAAGIVASVLRMYLLYSDKVQHFAYTIAFYKCLKAQTHGWTINYTYIFRLQFLRPCLGFSINPSSGTGIQV